MKSVPFYILFRQLQPFTTTDDQSYGVCPQLEGYLGGTKNAIYVECDKLCPVQLPWFYDKSYKTLNTTSRKSMR